jgi:hypothetical protein
MIVDEILQSLGARERDIDIKSQGCPQVSGDLLGAKETLQHCLLLPMESGRV